MNYPKHEVTAEGKQQIRFGFFTYYSVGCEVTKAMEPLIDERAQRAFIIMVEGLTEDSRMDRLKQIKAEGTMNDQSEGKAD